MLRLMSAIARLGRHASPTAPSSGPRGRPPDGAPYPAEFDPEIYRRYPDLAAMNDDELLQHYEEHGRTEGRIASAVCCRADFIALAEMGNAILEIGPFCSPAIRKKGVKYFDILDQKLLKERAKEHKLNPTYIPYIDYVSSNGDLSIVDEKFDIVFSSHAIEHQPDLIKHLRDVNSILRPEGSYFLIIPDKRFCFDHFIAETTLEDVISAHHETARRHRLHSVIEHLAFTTHNDPRRHWSGDHGDRLQSGTRDKIDSAVRYWRENPDSYIDVHAWQFTPANFRPIIADLNFLSYSDFYPYRVYDTPYGHLEFMAILRKNGSE